MRGIVIIFLLFFECVLTEAQEPDRLLAHQKAQKLLADLQFFSEGRGMTISPNFIDTYRFIAKVFKDSQPKESHPNFFSIRNPLVPFENRWGIIDADSELKGFFNISYKKMNIGVLGCVACHSGKAAGQYIIGLGNKRIDPGQVGRDAKMALQFWKSAHFFKSKSEDYRAVEERSLDFAKRLSDDRYTNLTEGLVPVAIIQQWFYLNAGKNLPANHGRGAVKVPHFWGYGKKRLVGQFWDGFGNGEHPGWGLLVELVGGQSVEGARKLMPKISRVEDELGNLLPPRYPFKINEVKAEAGKTIFENTCAHCHGKYEKDKNGFPLYQEPKFVSLEKVRTDADREKIITEEFLQLVEANPLHDEIKVHRRPPGYFAPRLEGIWSRFPYLHNASVPSVRALLTAPSERPRKWSLDNAGEIEMFDETNLGMKVKLSTPQKNGRNVYDVTKSGQSNEGHWFSFSKKFSEEEKDQIIEYLKTL